MDPGRKSVNIRVQVARGWSVTQATARSGSPFVLLTLKNQGTGHEDHVRLDLGKRMFIDQIGDSASADDFQKRASAVATEVSAALGF